MDIIVSCETLYNMRQSCFQSHPILPVGISWVSLKYLATCDICLLVEIGSKFAMLYPAKNK